MYKKRSMAATISFEEQSLGHKLGKGPNPHGVVSEEIEGLIRVFKDGHVERPQVMPDVTSSLAQETGVTARDVIIDKSTKIWARIYVPKVTSQANLPLLVYFHGGGFCVGSCSWICYHEFLSNLAAKAGCVIISVNYRLAPENPLPAAYEDGSKALVWVKQEASCESNKWWSQPTNFSKLFLGGDSAGANIAYNVATRLGSNPIVDIKGMVLIQPFFGGETLTNSEKYMVQPSRSALSLSAANTYWRLSLPHGANRDHPWCNPIIKGSVKLENLKNGKVLVCISENDILRDRNLDFCDALSTVVKKVEQVMFKGVGHAFQVLNKSQLAQVRSQEMMLHVKSFVNRS